MITLHRSLRSHGSLVAALAMSWLFAGWLGAQSVEIDAPATPLPDVTIQIQPPSEMAPGEAPPAGEQPAGYFDEEAASAPYERAAMAEFIRRNPNAQASVADAVPTTPSTGPQGAPGSVAGEVEGLIPGATVQTPDQFARPVDEEITEELVAATNLTGEETVIDRIFSERSRLQQLLGSEALFVYDSGGLRDPMIIPWIRREFDVANLLEVGRRLEREGRYGEALEAFATIVNEYGGSRAAGEAQDAIVRIQPLLRGSVASLGEVVTLPREITQNLTGIIDDEARPNCLIGDNIYGEGDVIPNYDVTILEIRQDAVVFFYRDKEFTVPVAVN